MNKENYIMRDRARNQCIIKIMSLDFPAHRKFWILGLNFFHNYYTVFDMDNKRVGFAESTYSKLNSNSLLS